MENGNFSSKLFALRFAKIFGLHELLNPLGNSPSIDTMCPPIALPFLDKIFKSTQIKSSILFLIFSDIHSDEKL